jgi:hypothetical protein
MAPFSCYTDFINANANYSTATTALIGEAEEVHENFRVPDNPVDIPQTKVQSFTATPLSMAVLGSYRCCPVNNLREDAMNLRPPPPPALSSFEAGIPIS